MAPGPAGDQARSAAAGIAVVRPLAPATLLHGNRVGSHRRQKWGRMRTRIASLLPLIAVAFLLQWHPRAARSADLEISLLPQSKRVVYGDPLYLELTLVNRTDAAVV